MTMVKLNLVISESFWIAIREKYLLILLPRL